MRVLITGANGQLGNCFRFISQAYNNITFFFTCKEELDIGDKEAVEVYVKEHSIETIINCAAYTAVEEAQNQSLQAYAVNAKAVAVLARIAKECALRLVHVSTDYVFDGRHYKPYEETDIPNPINVYGASKYEGECSLREINPKGCIIVRTSWLYSPFGHNFVKTMLRLGREKEEIRVVCDQIGAPTFGVDLAHVIMHLLTQQSVQEECQTYHYQNEGALSWYDFAKEIMKMAKLPARIEPIRSLEYPTQAKRPYMALLDTTKIKTEYGVKIPYWKDSLKVCLNEVVRDMPIQEIKPSREGNF